MKIQSFTQIVRHILNSCVKKEAMTIILRTSITLPCLQYQIIKADKFTNHRLEETNNKENMKT